MMTDLATLLEQQLDGNKMRLLRTKEMVDAMEPLVEPAAREDFLLLKKALLETDAVSILLASENESAQVRIDSVDEARDKMEACGISREDSKKLVKMLTLALGWDKKEASAPVGSEAPQTTQAMPPVSPVTETVQPFSQSSMAGRVSTASTRNKKYLLLAAVALLIGGIGYFSYAESAKNQPAEVPAPAAVEEQVPEPKIIVRPSNELALGNLELEMDEANIETAMEGKATIKRGDNAVEYQYPDTEITVKAGKVRAIITRNKDLLTKRGIHAGSTLQEVIDAYGPCQNRASEEGHIILNYSFKTKGGEAASIRFAFNDDENQTLNTTVMRIHEKEPVKAKYYTVTYFGGKNNRLQLSQNQLNIRVGDVITIVPRDGNNSESGFLRLMTDGDINKTGAVIPEGCIFFETEETGYKGSAKIYRLKSVKPGRAVYTVVPNYGSWEYATKIYITISP